ncbi:MAG: LD-carboxypeptidase [Deltaproteobacteria bacterium]|nr:LD-carboxypeptidase [Deltaproteobacteria bacterium]
MSAATKPLLPIRLQRGDYIGLAAPSGPLTDDITAGLRMLRDTGLNAVVSQDIDRRHNYLAGPDKRRIAELHELFRNPRIKAIWAVRGGFGCTRIIADLDYQLIKQNPKILIGFSDLTILLNTIHRQTGLITFHGPVLSTIIRDGQTALTDCLTALSLPRPPDFNIKGLEILRSGQAAGPIIGGNLTSMVSLLGTPYEPYWPESLLLLEDINEPAYKVDRMLTQLKLAGRLERIRGIILGDFLDGNSRPLGDIELIWQRVLEITAPNIPVWANFPVGHGPENRIMPIGSQVLMDSNTGCLKFQADCLRHHAE